MEVSGLVEKESLERGNKVMKDEVERRPGKAYLGFIMADFTGWNCTINWAGCPYVPNFLSNSEIPSKIFPFSLHWKKEFRLP